MKCPKCGYQPPKKPVGRPKSFTIEEEKEIVEDGKKMTLLEVVIKWRAKKTCSIGTIQNIINRNK